MTAFTKSDDLRGAKFVGTDLRGARFAGADLSGVVMRGVDLAGAEIDSPWLFEDENSLRVNGVDVMPLRRPRPRRDRSAARCLRRRPLSCLSRCLLS